MGLTKWIINFILCCNALEDNYISGHKNIAVTNEDMSGTTIIGSHNTIVNSSDSIIMGHNLSVINSLNSAVIGNEIELSDGNGAVVVGNYIKAKKSQVVLGSYNKESDAMLILSSGSSNDRSNILEIDKNGSIHSQQMNDIIESLNSLKLRVLQLETEVAKNNTSCTCNTIQNLYESIGCCQT